jgi:hypothetical protein
MLLYSAKFAFNNSNKWYWFWYDFGHFLKGKRRREKSNSMGFLPIFAHN